MDVLKSIFIYSTIYLALLPLAVGLFYYKKTELRLKRLLVYLALSVVLDQVALHFFLQSAKNMIDINLFLLFEKCLLFFLLFNCSMPNKKRIIGSYLLLLMFIIYWIYYVFFTSTSDGKSGINILLNVFSTLTSAIMVILAVVRVLRIVEKGLELFKNPIFGLSKQYLFTQPFRSL